MKTIKVYGVVADHGSKQLRLQTIFENKQKRLALVSYRDGMSVNVTDITEEAPQLKRLLENYLGYKTSKPEDNIEDEIVHGLCHLPATDGNYPVDKANAEQLTQAIEIMEKSDGKHATRIKACQTALNKLNKASIEVNSTIIKLAAKSVLKSSTTPSEAEIKEDKSESEAQAKIVEFPTEDKRPKIIKLKTEGSHTYEECEANLDVEALMFRDADSQYVIEGLKELCKVDEDFRNNVMRKDKSYGGFMEYMFKAARNGYCVNYGDVGWIDRDTGLSLAIDYYNHDEEKEKAIEEERKRLEKAKANKEKEAKSNGKKKSTKKKGTRK